MLGISEGENQRGLLDVQNDVHFWASTDLCGIMMAECLPHAYKFLFSFVSSVMVVK